MNIPDELVEELLASARPAMYSAQAETTSYVSRAVLEKIRALVEKTKEECKEGKNPPMGGMWV